MSTNTTTKNWRKHGIAIAFAIILLFSTLVGLTACNTKETKINNGLDGRAYAGNIDIQPTAVTYAGTATVVQGDNSGESTCLVEFSNNIVRLTDWGSGDLNPNTTYLGVFEGAQTYSAIKTKTPIASHILSSAAVTFPTASQYGKGWNISTFNLTAGQTYTFFPVNAAGSAAYYYSYINTYITYTHLAYVDLPAPPTKEGYTFNGWYYDQACTQPYQGALILEGTNLYAGWTINKYTVTFDTKFAGITVSSQTVDYNTVVTAPTINAPAGYTFGGWYTDAACTKAYDFETTVKSNMTLYAKWEVKTYTVTFYVDGEVYATVEVPHGGKLSDIAQVSALLNNITGVYDDAIMFSIYNVKAEVTNDIELYAAFTPEMQKWINFGDFFLNWGWLAVAAGVLVFIGLCCVITYFAARAKR